MFKYSAMVSAIIGTMLFISGPAPARPAICEWTEVQAWLRYHQIMVRAECRDDQTGDWGIKINFDNNQSPFDDEADAMNAVCTEAMSQCNASHGADVKSCLLARDNHCNYDPCTCVWIPYCDSSNNCINAYTYCGGYLSGACSTALMNCYYGGDSSCGYLYATCRLQSCAEIWKPFCDAYNNCYISYNHCGGYLSGDCVTAVLDCFFNKDQKACNFAFDGCGYPKPR